MVDYGAYYDTGIKGFYRFLRKILKKILKKFFRLKKKTTKTEEDLYKEVKKRFITYFNKHHVFAGGLINGAKAYGLSKTGLEGKYACDNLNMDETKLVLVPAHCAYNKLFGNNSPPDILKMFSDMLKGRFISVSEKIFFIKLSLCILMEKCFLEKSSEKFDKIRKTFDGVVFDVNNGNHNTARMIIEMFGITPAEAICYLKENFFPNNFKKYPEELWDLYLR